MSKYVVSITIYEVWGPEDEKEWDIEDMETIGEYETYEEAKTKMDTFPWLRTFVPEGSSVRKVLDENGRLLPKDQLPK